MTNTQRMFLGSLIALLSFAQSANTAPGNGLPIQTPPRPIGVPIISGTNPDDGNAGGGDGEVIDPTDGGDGTTDDFSDDTDPFIIMDPVDFSFLDGVDTSELDFGVALPPEHTGGVIMYSFRAASHPASRSKGARYANYYRELAVLQAYIANPFMDWRYQGYLARHHATAALTLRTFVATRRLPLVKKPAAITPKKPAAAVVKPVPRSAH